MTAPLPAVSMVRRPPTSSVGPCSPLARSVTCNWTSIPASNNFFVTVVVTPTVGGTATLAVNVAGTPPDPNTAANNVDGEVPVHSQIDFTSNRATAPTDPHTHPPGNVQDARHVVTAMTSLETPKVLR